MPKLYWAQAGNKCSAPCLDYMGVITHNTLTNEFDAHVEATTGEFLSSWDGFSTFDRAEEWVLFVTIEHEQSDKAFGLQRMRETFALCRSMFDPDADKSHIERLASVEQWYVTRMIQAIDLVEEAHQSIATAQLSDSSSQHQEFQWTEEEDGIFTVNTPYGKAIIQEIRKQGVRYAFGSRIKHTASIEHPSGVRMTMGWEVSDFLEAESWVRTQVEQLAETRVDEQFLRISNLRSIYAHIFYPMNRRSFTESAYST
jgi:hypothetical protein